MDWFKRLFSHRQNGTDDPASAGSPFNPSVSDSTSTLPSDSLALPLQQRAAFGNRRIRVFISSTFRDMIEERDTLMTHAWPELRRF